MCKRVVEEVGESISVWWMVAVKEAIVVWVDCCWISVFLYHVSSLSP